MVTIETKNGPTDKGEEDRHEFNVRLEQAKLLFDYTKFHIGLYGGAITALLALSKYILGDNSEPWLILPILFSVVCIVLAGAAGGIVASNVPEHDFNSSYSELCVGPFDWKWPKASVKSWSSFEHKAFWLGLIVGLIAIFSSVVKGS